MNADDGLPASFARPWAKDKHRELERYIDATWAARAKWTTSAYVDLFSGPGKQLVEDTGEVIDGSPLVAWRASRRHEAPFGKVLISDSNSSYVNARETRLKALGAPVLAKSGPAVECAGWAAAQVDRSGLQLVFADPYNLSDLPWDVFEILTRLRNIDFIVHFSQQDLARNLDRYFEKEDSVLDLFAPGWRKHVDQRNKVQMRGRFLEYWISLFERMGFHAARRMPLVTTGTNVPLYRLVFLARHPFPKGIWESLDPSPQKNLFG